VFKTSFVSFFIFCALGFQALAFDIPTLTGPVMDEVGLLNSSTQRQIENSLFELRRAQGVQLQVYIVKSLQGEGIEGAAIKIFDKWKLGEEKTDKGLLFLIAPTEKRMRIEVGQGLEGDIPDVIAKRIIAEVVRPYFQRNEYANGVIQGVVAIEQQLGKADANLQSTDQHEVPVEAQSKSRGGGWIILIAIAIWIVLFIFNPSLALYILFSGFGGGRGGGGGGGGWSGGGGSSFGGGASGDW
jgi:uncharacterized protein